MSRRTVIGIALALVVVIGVRYFVLSRRPKPPEPTGARTPEPAGTKPPVQPLVEKVAPKRAAPVEKVVREWTIPDEDAPREMFFSPSGEFLTYQCRDKRHLVFNGRRSGPYDKILWHAVSGDGEQVAFCVSLGKKELMVINGVEGKPYDEVADQLFRRASSETRSFAKEARPAYAAREGTKSPWHVVCDGKEGPAFDRILGIISSEDGRHVAYAAVRGEEACYVFDGKETPMFDAPRARSGSAAFSPDGTRFAYAGNRGGTKFAGCDGKESSTYDEIGRMTFSPDSRRLAFVAIRGRNDYCVVVDGVEGPRADLIYEFSFSPDSQHVAWCALKGKDWALFVDGKEQAKDARLCRYAADGRLYWMAKEGEQWFHVWHNARFPTGVPSGTLTPDWPSFSPNGQHMAYWIRKGQSKMCLMLDGKPCRYIANAGPIRWSPDGEHVLHGYQYGDLENYVVSCDDRLASVSQPQADLVFSPDGQHAAYRVFDRGGQYVSCDGFRLPAHRAIYSLMAGDKLRYATVEPDGRTAHFIEIDWPGNGAWKDGFLKDSETASFTQDPPPVVPALPSPPAGEALVETVVREWRAPSNVRPNPLAFSRTGSLLTYRLTGEKDTLVFNDKHMTGYDDLVGPMPVYGGEHVAWLATRDGRQMMVVDGVEGKAHKAVKPLLLATSWFGPDGKRVVYAARDEGEAGWHLVWGDQEGPAYDRFVEVVFSPDGAHMAYCATRGQQAFFVCDGKELPAFVSPLFGPPGPSASDEPVDGALAYKGNAAFSPDGTRFAYVVRHQSKDQRQYQIKFSVISDGKEGPEYDAVKDVRISPDGKRLAYVASSRRRQFVVIDGEEGPKADTVSALNFSPDSRHIAWVAGDKEGNTLFLDGRELAKNVMSFWFSGDDRLSWSVLEGEARFYVLEGKRVPVEADPFVPMTFSRDGRHTAFVGKAGEGKERRCVVRDGKPGRSFSDVLTAMQWSPDGEHLLYTAQEREGQSFAVWCDNLMASVGTAQIEKWFSPDGLHAAYCVSGPDGVSVSCDGMRGRPHERVSSLTATDKLRYIALDEGRTVARFIEVDWPSDRTWREGFKEPEQ